MSMDKIADTLAHDFTAAVKAETKDRQAAISVIMTQIAESNTARAEGLKEVSELLDEADRIFDEARRKHAVTEDAHQAAQRDVQVALNTLRGPALVASHDRPRAIAGGKP